MKKQFGGIIPPVSIIFDEQGNLDQKGMERVIDFLVENKVDGLFFLGSGGEFTQLSTKERKEITTFVIEYVNKRLPVLIGTGSTNTREAIELSKHAFDNGADGIIVINPYYWNLSEENLYLHYKEIVESINGPVILYNFPELTKQSLSPELVLRLVENHENIVGIKDTIDSTGHIRDMIEKVKRKYPGFSVFAGFDDHLLNTLVLGGDGAISASVNFAPSLSVGLYEAFQNGDYEKAFNLHQKLAQLPLLYQLELPFINVVKEATKLCGIDISTYVQPPARVIEKHKKEQIKQVLQQTGILKEN